MESVEENNEKIVRFKTGIELGKLIDGSGVMFQIDTSDFPTEEQLELTDREEREELLKYSNLQCLGLDDEDTYGEEPFEHIAKKMVNITSDDKVKKRILREGVGEGLPKEGYVICDYNAFTEYVPEPFDSTYAYKRPLKYNLTSCSSLIGLDIAIKSMKVNEKSQFLIHPDLAYGEMGCLNRVPANATILFEIEIKNCFNSINHLDSLLEENKDSFEFVYEYAEALRLKGNELFNKGLVKQAIKEYNTAFNKLENSATNEEKEEEKRQVLLLKLLTNLVVSYNKCQKPKLTCSMTNKIMYLVKGTSLKVPAKVYFHNARALIMLSEYYEAERKLLIAKRMEPDNNEIAQEFIRLNKLKNEVLDKEKNMAKACLGIKADDIGNNDAKDLPKKSPEDLANDDNDKK